MSNAYHIRRALKLAKMLKKLKDDGFTHIVIQKPDGTTEEIPLP